MQRSQPWPGRHGSGHRDSRGTGRHHTGNRRAGNGQRRLAADLADQRGGLEPGSGRQHGVRGRSVQQGPAAGVAAGGAGEIDAQNIFAYDIRTGNPISNFSHSLNAQALTITASPDGSRVYIGGDFTTVDGAARNHVAAFDTATGALDTAFAPNVSNEVKALAASANTLYIGGGYGSVNGSGRNNLAAVNHSGVERGLEARRRDNGDRLVHGAGAGRQPADRRRLVHRAERHRCVRHGSISTATPRPAVGSESDDPDAGKEGAITSLRTDGKQIFGPATPSTSAANFEAGSPPTRRPAIITVVNDCHGDTYDVLPIGQVLYSVGHVP